MFEVYSQLTKEKTESMIALCNNACKRVGLSFQKLVLIDWKYIHQSIKKGVSEVKFNGFTCPLSILYSPLGTFQQLCAGNGVIIYCEGVPEDTLGEIQEIDIAHELIHINHDDISITNFYERLLAKGYCARVLSYRISYNRKIYGL